MSSDDLRLDIAAPLADDLRAAADACELSVEDYVRIVLSAEAQRAAEALGWSESDDPAIDEAIAADYDRTGIAVPWEEVRAWMKSWGSENELPAPIARKLR
jgi:hypothetical protein